MQERLAQLKSVESSMSQKIGTECYMISKQWWSTWQGYATGKSEVRPGPINNLALMYLILCVTKRRTLSGSYKVQAETAREDPELYGKLGDWTQMHLREGIRNEEDYLLVNTLVW